MLEVEGTELQLSLGFAWASLMLASEMLGAAVRRGDISMIDASAIFAASSANVAKGTKVFPGDPEVMKIAENALKLMARLTLAHSAQKPTEGSH